jgi:hypothetical protein
MLLGIFGLLLILVMGVAVRGRILLGRVLVLRVALALISRCGVRLRIRSLCRSRTRFLAPLFLLPRIVFRFVVLIAPCSFKTVCIESG